jgi:glucan phosphoethanolaminetransferase (alkaline phosphatase superfamily)
VKYLGTIRIKEIVFLSAVLVTVPALSKRLFTDGTVREQVSYLALVALLWSAIMAAAYIRPLALRWLTALVLSLSAYFLTVFQFVTSQFMTYDAFINMINSAGFIGEALVQSRTAFISAAGPALLLLLGMGLAPQRERRLLPTWISAGAPWLAAAILAGMLFIRGGESDAGLPPSFTPIAYLALASYEAAITEVGPRQPVQLPHKRRPLSNKIVLIIDESVAGQYLDINSPNGVPTPLSRAWPGINIQNYGLAASITDCSAGSNVTLRYGGTRADYKRIIATQPSIWAYAHAAGMRTVYIDAQMASGALQNFMTKAERAEIDTFIQLADLPVSQRDMTAGQLLVQQLADPRPKFILVNKSGLHFPIQDRYPDDYLRYRPALPRGVRDTLHTGKQLGFNGTPPEWVRYRNSYRNALLWNVGAFFGTVLHHGELADTTLIYTSDHGQNLHEDGSSGLYTHCSPEPVPQEGVVPLVVIEGNGASGLDWNRHMSQNYDRSSHYMIFPTLLELMGYDRVASEVRYGRPLNAPSTDPGTFNMLFNARLSRQPVWLSIEPAKAIQPLSSDSAPARVTWAKPISGPSSYSTNVEF